MRCQALFAGVTWAVAAAFGAAVWAAPVPAATEAGAPASADALRAAVIDLAAKWEGRLKT
jgi:hypothetical protein